MLNMLTFSHPASPFVTRLSTVCRNFTTARIDEQPLLSRNVAVDGRFPKIRDHSITKVKLCRPVGRSQYQGQ